MATSSRGNVHLAAQSFPACLLSPPPINVETARSSGNPCNSCQVASWLWAAPCFIYSPCYGPATSSGPMSPLVPNPSVWSTWTLGLQPKSSFWQWLFLWEPIHPPHLPKHPNPWLPSGNSDDWVRSCSACLPNIPLPTHPFRFHLEALFSQEPCKSPRSTSKREWALPFSLCSVHSFIAANHCVSQYVHIWLLPHWAVTWRKRACFLSVLYSFWQDAWHKADCLEMFVEWMNNHYYLTYPIYTNITAILRAWSPIFDFIWQRKEEIKSFCDTVEFA